MPYGSILGTKSTLVRLVPHHFVSEDSDADREDDDESVANGKHPLTAHCSPSFPLRRAIGTQCRDRAENLYQEKHKSFRSQVDQSRLSARGSQMPPEMYAGVHANHILTISGLSAPGECTRWQARFFRNYFQIPAAIPCIFS